LVDFILQRPLKVIKDLIALLTKISKLSQTLHVSKVLKSATLPQSLQNFPLNELKIILGFLGKFTEEVQKVEVRNTMMKRIKQHKAVLKQKFKKAISPHRKKKIPKSKNKSMAFPNFNDNCESKIKK
jgi:hypothetical protein